ncbi:MAG: flagellar protein G [Halobacteriota archaeon]|nr:flagellar protein G [Halobacteriota archaeon]
MAESAASHAIYFIAAVIMATAVIGVINASVQDVTTASSESSKLLSGQMKTDITIISDPDEIPNDDTFYVKNTGTKTLDGDLVNVIVNGTYIMEVNLTKSVIGRSDLVWETTDILKIELMNVTLPSGDHRIKVITQNGISDTMDFTI